MCWWGDQRARRCAWGWGLGLGGTEKTEKEADNSNQKQKAIVEKESGGVRGSTYLSESANICAKSLRGKQLAKTPYAAHTQTHTHSHVPRAATFPPPPISTTHSHTHPFPPSPNPVLCPYSLHVNYSPPHGCPTWGPLSSSPSSFF